MIEARMPLYTDSLLNSLAIRCEQHRATLELNTLGAILASPAEFLPIADEHGVRADALHFEDLRLIHQMSTFDPHGDLIGFVAHGLAKRGWWRLDGDTRDLGHMRDSQIWSATTLYGLFHSYPASPANVVQTAAALARHTRQTRDAIEHVEHAARLLTGCTAAGAEHARLGRCRDIAERVGDVETAIGFEVRMRPLEESRPRLDPLEMARELVALARLTELPVEVLADSFEEQSEQHPRRVA